MTRPARRPHCSFCGASPDDVEFLITGFRAAICCECVAKCADLIADRLRALVALEAGATAAPHAARSVGSTPPHCDAGSDPEAPVGSVGTDRPLTTPLHAARGRA